MSPALITLLNNLAFAFLAALLLTTLSLLVLLRRTKQNEANKSSPRLRDQHQTSIPRWGGVGILIGLLTTLLLSTALPFEQVSSPLSGSYLWLLISAAFACGLGFLDDQQNLRARYKLLGQLVLGIFTATVIFRPDTLQLPLIGLVEIGWFGGPLMVLWVVGVMNAINLVDGLDGAVQFGPGRSGFARACHMHWAIGLGRGLLPLPRSRASALRFARFA